ncbi:AMP-binding protein [Streptomyces sp. NPDC048483]|uniref:AMP-binding protein n=1 Tax=Streptomyces sp. NPDC048483 TaxID=3154927 RepID=UPI00343B41AA
MPIFPRPTEFTVATAGDHALHSRFLRGLAASPLGVAVQVGSDSLTYTRLHERALLWAGALAGTRPRAVGVLCAKGLTAYTGVLAALYAGAAVVPLRPDFPLTRTREMLALSGASVLIVDDRGAEVLPGLLEGRLAPAVFSPDDEATGTLSAHAEQALEQPLRVASDDPAYVLFTSGSTGRPKGVVVSHGATSHYFGLLDARYDFTPGDAFSQAFDLNFDCSMFDMFCAWGAGARLVAIPPQAYVHLPAFLAEYGITVWFSTPGTVGLVRGAGGLGVDSMPGLRWSFLAGEALQCRDAADWQRAAPGSVLENLYGPTELTVTIAAHRWSEERSSLMAVNGIVPIGALNQGHEYLLLDEAGEVTGLEGELCVTGPQMSAGYLDPADEADRFVESDGRRWYRTGDRVREIDDGELAYLGRTDSQVQVHGWRVELGEVEHVLRTDATVDDAVTVPVEVGGSAELVVFYTGSVLPAIEFARRLRRTLPSGIIPRFYHRLDAFPLNSNKKVDRSLLTVRARELFFSDRSETRPIRQKTSGAQR